MAARAGPSEPTAAVAPTASATSPIIDIVTPRHTGVPPVQRPQGAEPEGQITCTEPAQQQPGAAIGSAPTQPHAAGRRGGHEQGDADHGAQGGERAGELSVIHGVVLSALFVDPSSGRVSG